MENHVTVLLEAGKPIFSPSFALGVLRKFLPEEKVESVKSMALTADGNGAVFYVAAEDLDLFLAGQENAANVSITMLKSLPDLQEKESRNTRFGGGGRFGHGGGGFRSDSVRAGNLAGRRPWLEHTAPRGVGTLVDCRAPACHTVARGEQS